MSLDRPPAWLAPLERLEAKLRSKPSVVDATVVSVDPIRVQLDGKPSPVAPSPSTVVPVAVGDRVWVMHHGKTRLRIIGVIGGSGAMLLDEIALTGANNHSAAHVLTVPQSVRGRLRKYVVSVNAGSSGYSGATARALCIWINSRLEDEYRHTTILRGGVELTSAEASTSFPRTGYIHGFTPGALEVTFIPVGLGSAGLVSWTTTGWANAGSADGIVVMGGGRWNGPAQTITEFRIGTNVTGEDWAAGSRAQLWGYR